MFGLFSTCHITSLPSETHYFTGADAWSVLLGYLALLAVLFLAKKSKLRAAVEKRPGAFTAALLTVLAALSLWWVLAAGVRPEADQLTVISIADAWRNNKFDELLKGGYLYKYPHQIGLVMFYYLTSFICGQGNTLFWQILNIPALIFGVLFLARTAGVLFPAKWTVPAVTGCCCLFLPMLFYTSFNYGTLYGFFCSMAAFYLLVRFLRDGGWGRMLGMAVLAALAVELKQNYLVSLLAMAAVLLLNAIREKKLRPVIGAALLFAASFLLSGGVSRAAENMSGIPASQGVPKTAWIMMGLEESKRAPGWYNDDTLKLYEACGEDTQTADASARAEIKARLSKFKADPAYAAEFFSKKTASQWDEPTFQCFWVSSVRKSFDGSPQAVKDILAGGASLRIEGFLRYYEMFVCLGVLCFIIFRRGGLSESALLFAVTFIGGFLFHTFWEAKAEYTFLYFALLIPYAVQGWTAAALLPGSLRREKSADRRRAALSLLLTALLIVHPNFVRCDLGLASDDAAYRDYADGVSAACGIEYKANNYCIRGI